MKTLNTIKKNLTLVAAGFVVAVMLAASGLVSLPGSPAATASAAVVERDTKPNASTAPDSVRAEAPTRAKPTVDEKPASTGASEERARTESGKRIGAGEASFYGRRCAGRATASGERFDPSALTAAHRTLPFGSKVRVTNTANGRSIVVRVNDRGPYAHGRLIDLSRGAAECLGMIQSGTAHVELQLLS